MGMPQGKRTVTDAEIVATIRDTDGPACTASEIADEVGMTPEGVRRRLNTLQEHGRVNRKKPSYRVVLWWIDG